MAIIVLGTIQVIFNIALDETSMYYTVVHMAFHADKLQMCAIHKHQTLYCYYRFSSLVQIISGFHSEVHHTKITVLWTWRTLVKVMMLCCAAFPHCFVVGLTQETGSSPMELESPHQAYSGNSTVRTCFRTWYICTAEEVVWLESTAVKYFVEQILSRTYTLVYTHQTLVSVICNKLELMNISSGTYCRCTYSW